MSPVKNVASLKTAKKIWTPNTLALKSAPEFGALLAPSTGMN